MMRERFQSASRVLLIRPTGFGRDDEAAQTNLFMRQPTETADRVQRRAIEEFEALSKALRDAGVEVLEFEDDLGLPDSVFPNNWVSFHQPMEGDSSRNPVIVTYPMCAAARRRERRAEVLAAIAEFTHCEPDHVDLSGLEDSGEFLEGTGSLVLDRVNGVAYACVSGRTTDQAIDTWCDEMGYRVVRFHAADQNGNPVYHTNVIMSIGSDYAVVCLSSITDPDEYDEVAHQLKGTGRQILEITQEQVSHFCGNILELRDQQAGVVFAMSQSAWTHFSEPQRAWFEAHGRVVAVEIPTIEYVSGGSVRCMIAELGSGG